MPPTPLFNYFFRGTLEITPPKIGVYGIVDDSVENQKDTTGFRKVKLRLKNTTPSNTGWGNQDMNGGSLTAVVKFHRNTCYTPDLANEWDDTGKSGRLSGTCRSTDEEIVTSNRDDQGNPITGVKLTAGGDSQDLAFDFSATPIPVNATDVYLQVVYRGAQGTEADAVVVATADISEPTHLMLRNVTNSFICINQSWYKLNHDSSVPKAVKPILKAAGGGTVSPSAYTVVTTSFQQSDQLPFVTSAPNFTLPLTYPLVELPLGQQLQPAQYMRVSMLTPPQTYFAHYFEGTSGAYQYFNTQSFEGAESEITFTQDKVNSSTTVTTPLLGVNSYLSTFGYQNFGTGDCEHTNDAPTDYLGADGVAFTSPSTLVAAKIDF